jgi:DNA-binding response OmpR family regulator
MSTLFRREGKCVEVVATVEEAIRKLNEGNWSALLMDWSFGEHNASNLLRAAQKHSKPVAILSGSEEAPPSFSLAAGCSWTLLRKPATKEAIWAALKIG